MADCLTCLLDHGKSIVTEAVCPPIKRHVGYWWLFDDNIQGLRDEIRSLDREKGNMDQKIEEARQRAESATTEAKDWLDEVAKNLVEGRRILQGCDELKHWNIISRYHVGKSAKKTADGIATLRREVNLIRTSDPAPPPSMVPIPHEPTMEFGSRGRIEVDIMKFLNDEHAHMVAICGPGGVGKTTMVRRIEDRVRKENLFDEVVHVVVSQQIDVLKIQKEIAELLGLSLIEDTLAARAHKLHMRLVDSKRKLIVFDDIWKRLNLTDLGVPPSQSDSVRCKIILTSRVEDACKKMNAQKIIRMVVLTEAEAWDLFKEKAGSCVEGSDLRLIAEDVAKECKGLPLALVIVGEALKDQSIYVWRDSLTQLRRSIPTYFPEVSEDVYKPLKLSYDFLENESVKSLFLICCLFPEDYTIRTELLNLYSIGLGMLERIRNIEEGRIRTHSFVEKLKSRFLLIDHDSWEQHVKMHDVVRDVAIFIGSEERHGFLKNLEVSTMRSASKDSSHNCNWMSIDISVENAKLPVGSDFPNLRLLIVRGSYSVDSSQLFDANVICFKAMEELNVLSFSHVHIRSLPPTMALLKQLTTLHLENSSVKDISVAGELASLEILCIRRCDRIEELPADIGRLNRLRLLELYYCRCLKRIVAGVISSLVGLEELKIIDSFYKWEAKGNQSEGRNAGLSELESLRSLTCLEIDIWDHDLLAQELCLSQQLVRYMLRIHDEHPFLGKKLSERDISLLRLSGDITVGNWIHQLVRRTQSLRLDGDGSNIFNLADTESLRRLAVVECSTMKKLVNAIDCNFRVLEKLELSNLEELEQITDGTIPEGSKSFENLERLDVDNLPEMAHLWKSLNQDVSLGKLKYTFIEDCPNLRYLFSVATARSLVQLEEFIIWKCGMIEQLFWNEIESNTYASSIIEFPKLEELELDELPNLAAFSQGYEIVEFPRLAKLQITGCPKLRFKVGKCPHLRTFEVSTFNDLHYLLSSCYTREWNRQLETLVIRNSDTIQELFVDEIEDEGNRSIIFSELKKLKLNDMPCLTTFYRGVESIKFPKLENMKIVNLPRLCNLLPMDSEPSHDHHSLHFFCNQKVEIPCLDKLHIRNLHDDISKIWCRKVPNNFFHNLEKLTISDLNGIRNLISSAIAINLVNLKELIIKGCQEMVEVVEDDEDVFVTSLFPKLHRVTIKKLQKLRSFCRWKHTFELPSLESIRIVDCPALGSLSSPNLPRLNTLLPMDSEPSHDNHFFCHKKVEIPRLAEVEISNLQDDISRIWCRQVPNNNFQNLEKLDIGYVNGIRNLMQFSIAKNLVNLQFLHIKSCQEMVEVVEDDEEVCVTSLFPKLVWFTIRKLQKLKSFCQWKHTFELPSLESIEIVDCPAMETFSLGSLSSPNLDDFRINGKAFQMKVLNDGIRDHFMKRQEGDKESKYSCENDEQTEDMAGY